MGTISHHGIMVTSFDRKKIFEAREKARLIFDNLVSSIVRSKINGFESFCVFPDGSKEGWGASDQFDESREKFISWLSRDDYFDWIEFHYGELGKGVDN